VSGGRAFSPSFLQEVIKKYHIGQGRKKRKSQSSTSNKTSIDNSILSFTKPVTIPKDSRTGGYRKTTSITIPKGFWNSDLIHRFSDIDNGSFLSIKITNPSFCISASHTYQTDDRHRITLTNKLINYFGIIHESVINFQVLRHISASQTGHYPGPVTCIANIKIYNEGIARVNVPEKLKELTGLSSFEENRFIHWKFGDREGTGRLYSDTTIGIPPFALGIPPDSPPFNSEFTIINSNLSPHEASKLTDNSRSLFLKSELKNIEEL